MSQNPSETDLPVWPHQVAGGKHVRQLERVLREMRQESTHGNRKLFLDDVFVVQLLAFFNPSVRSLRTMEDFSQTRQAQKHLSVGRLCKSTLSDFHRLTDPQLLLPVINDLRRRLGNQVTTTDPHLGQLLDQVIAVDGTFFTAVAEVDWAVRSSNHQGHHGHRARVDCHLNVTTWVPQAIVVPQPGQSESESAASHVTPGRIHLYDRGFNGFGLINAHYQVESAAARATSHFVMRYRTAGKNAPSLKEFTDNDLSTADRQAGVVSDRVGRFHSSANARHQLLDVPLREVIVEYQEATEEAKSVRLITNMLDVSAATIARLYRYRWQVELFFRWLKCFGNFNHLISHSRSGVQLNFYVTVIAVMLMYLHTGFRPSKYTFSLMSQVATGGATLEEILPILRERERRCERDRKARRKRREKLKQAN